jgi:hypothetical protein
MSITALPRKGKAERARGGRRRRREEEEAEEEVNKRGDVERCVA